VNCLIYSERLFYISVFKALITWQKNVQLYQKIGHIFVDCVCSLCVSSFILFSQSLLLSICFVFWNPLFTEIADIVYTSTTRWTQLWGRQIIYWPKFVRRRRRSLILIFFVLHSVKYLYKQTIRDNLNWQCVSIKLKRNSCHLWTWLTYKIYFASLFLFSCKF
jgi:hypothetical protein